MLLFQFGETVTNDVLSDEIGGGLDMGESSSPVNVAVR